MHITSRILLLAAFLLVLSWTLTACAPSPEESQPGHIEPASTGAAPTTPPSPAQPAMPSGEANDGPEATSCGEAAAFALPPAVDVASQTRNSEAVSAAVVWHASCETHDDCAGVGRCEQHVCTIVELQSQACDRNHRVCDGALGLECDRFGVPTALFRCDDDHVCSVDPLTPPCVLQACSPGAVTCSSSTRRTICADNGRFRISLECDPDTICLDGQCLPSGHEPRTATCAETAPVRLVANDTGLRLSLEHCSANNTCAPNTVCACSDGACSSVGCVPNDVRCVGTHRQQTCQNDRRWQPSVFCEDGTSCVAGRCRESTCAGDIDPECVGSAALRCQDDEWELEDCPFGCEAGRCRQSECTPGATSCANDSAVSICDEQGHSHDVPCPSDFACVEGECVRGVCTPGDVVDLNSESRRCNPTGTSWEPIERETRADRAPLRAACRRQNTDRLRDALTLRGNFDAECVVEGLSATDVVSWALFREIEPGRYREQPVDPTALHAPEADLYRLETFGTFRVPGQPAGTYAARAVVRHSDETESTVWAQLEFDDTADFIVELVVTSSLDPANAQTDNTNLNLYVRAPDHDWITGSSVASVFKPRMSALPVEVLLERYSDRPGDQEFATISHAEPPAADDPNGGALASQLELAVQYLDGVHTVEPHIFIYQGRELREHRAGPQLGWTRAAAPDDRVTDEQVSEGGDAEFADVCVGPVWLAGTLDLQSGTLTGPSLVRPVFPSELTAHCGR